MILNLKTDAYFLFKTTVAKQSFNSIIHWKGNKISKSNIHYILRFFTLLDDAKRGLDLKWQLYWALFYKEKGVREPD